MNKSKMEPDVFILEPVKSVSVVRTNYSTLTGRLRFHYSDF